MNDFYFLECCNLLPFLKECFKWRWKAETKRDGEGMVKVDIREVNWLWRQRVNYLQCYNFLKIGNFLTFLTDRPIEETLILKSTCQDLSLGQKKYWKCIKPNFKRNIENV